MPNKFVYNTYRSIALSGGILDNVLGAVVAAKEAATSKKEIQTVDVLYRGFRSDIVWGKIMVIPHQVCDDIKNLPAGLTKGAGVRVFHGEELADFETIRLADSEYDEVSPELVDSFKRKLFQGENNRFVPVLLFVPAWTNPRDWSVVRWESDEARLKALIAHLCFACYYNPSFSKLFNELVTPEGNLDLVHLTDQSGAWDIFKSAENAYPELEKRASTSRLKIAASATNVDKLKRELHTEQIGDEETKFFSELEEKIDDKIKTPKEATKTAGHTFWVPGQVLREFYPEIEQNLLKYPAQNNSGMPEPKLDTSGGPAAESINPKPTVTNETVPLRREMQLRGPGFMEDFYRSVVNIAPNYLQMVSSQKSAAVLGETLEVAETETINEKYNAKEQLRTILQGVCGEIAATIITAYKVTSTPLALNVPGEGHVALGCSNAIPPALSTQTDMFLEDRIKAICAKLNDGDLQEILNDTWAQAAVWCASPNGGFTYEVLIRAEAFDDETLTLRYKYVTNKK